MTELLPGMNLDISGYMSQFMFWGGWILFLLLWFGILAWIFVEYQYKIKIYVFKMTGTLTGGLTAGKPKKERVKWNKTKTGWIKRKPFFGKKGEIEPFSEKYMHGNVGYAFEMSDGTWIPVQISIRDDGSTGTIGAVPHHIRNWQSLQYKKNAIETRSDDDLKRQMLQQLGTVFICFIMVCVTVYFCYRITDSNLGAARNAFEAGIQTLTNKVGGVVPPG